MKVFRALNIVLLVCATAALASATQVELQFNGNGSNNYGGIATYPYYFTVTDLTDGTAPESALLMCVSFNEHITYGETWDTTKMTVAQYGSLLPGTTINGQFFTGAQVANGLAYLYTQAWRDGGKNSVINAAAWYLNEGSPSYTSEIGSLVTKALEAPSGAYNGGLSVYVPMAGSQTWQGETPQTFFGGTPTPEPSSLMLLGSGTIGLAGLLRKRFVT
jgi:hypothetical protein